MNSYVETDHIFVTKYLYEDFRDCLYVKVPGHDGIVVTHNMSFLGITISQTSHTRYYEDRGLSLTFREDVKAAVRAYIEKDGFLVTDYTGDKEYKGCVFVSKPNELGYVVNPLTRKFLGFASTPESAITEKLDSGHPYMEAIDEYLFNREGMLQKNGLTVSHYVGNCNYRNHILVKTKNIDFVCCRLTRIVVASITPDGTIASGPFVNKEYLKDDDVVIIFYTTIDEFLRGERSPPKLTLKDHLEPFREEYLTCINTDPKFMESSVYYSLVGKILTTIPDEFVEEIFSMYPTLGRSKSLDTALIQFLGKH